MRFNVDVNLPLIEVIALSHNSIFWNLVYIDYAREVNLSSRTTKGLPL